MHSVQFTSLGRVEYSTSSGVSPNSRSSFPRIAMVVNRTNTIMDFLSPEILFNGNFDLDNKLKYLYLQIEKQHFMEERNASNTNTHVIVKMMMEVNFLINVFTYIISVGFSLIMFRTCRVLSGKPKKFRLPFYRGIKKWSRRFWVWLVNFLREKFRFDRLVRAKNRLDRKCQRVKQEFRLRKRSGHGQKFSIMKKNGSSTVSSCRFTCTTEMTKGSTFKAVLVRL